MDQPRQIQVHSNEFDQLFTYHHPLVPNRSERGIDNGPLFPTCAQAYMVITIEGNVCLFVMRFFSTFHAIHMNTIGGFHNSSFHCLSIGYGISVYPFQNTPITAIVCTSMKISSRAPFPSTPNPILVLILFSFFQILVNLENNDSIRVCPCCFLPTLWYSRSLLECTQASKQNKVNLTYR